MTGNKVGVFIIKKDEQEYIIYCSRCECAINTLYEGYIRHNGNVMCHDCAIDEMRNGHS